LDYPAGRWSAACCTSKYMAGTCTQLERPGLSWRTGEISLWDWESGCHGFSDNRVLLCHLERSRKICIGPGSGAPRAVMASLARVIRFTRAACDRFPAHPLNPLLLRGLPSRGCIDFLYCCWELRKISPSQERMKTIPISPAGILLRSLVLLFPFESATFGLLWRINVCDVLPFGIVRRQPPSAMLTKTKHHAEVISTKRRVSALNARRNLSFLFWALHVLGWFRWRRAFGFVTGPMTFS